MASPTLREVLAGIETRLLTIDGLRVTGYAPDQINPPQAIIMCPPVASYQTSLASGRPILEVQVVMLVSTTITRVGQLLLADYANPTGTLSVPTAIGADPTLGGLAAQCQVRSYEALTAEEVGLLSFWGGKFHLRVTT